MVERESGELDQKKQYQQVKCPILLDSTVVSNLVPNLDQIISNRSTNPYQTKPTPGHPSFPIFGTPDLR